MYAEIGAESMDIDRDCTDVGKLDRHQVSVNSKLGAQMSPRSRRGIILGCAGLACLTLFAQGDPIMFVAVLFLLFLLAYGAFVVGIS